MRSLSDAGPQGVATSSTAGEESILWQVVDGAVLLPYYVLCWLPYQILSSLWWGMSTAVVATSDALTQATMYVWDATWNFIIWVVTLPARAWSYLFSGDREEEITGN